jgi:hypothetical protein
MFGGLAFMVSGGMACGVVGDELMARVGPRRYEEALRRPHARPMDFTGRPLRGMVYVGADGIRTAAALKKWIREVVAFAEAPKPTSPRRPGASAKKTTPQERGPKTGRTASRATNSASRPARR